MANEQNLNTPFSPSEAREQGAKGGVKSGEVRRLKAFMKAFAEMVLQMPVHQPSRFSQFMDLMGIKKTEQTYAMVVVVKLVIRAADGAPEDYDRLMQLLGDDAKQQKEAVEALLKEKSQSTSPGESW